MFRSQSQKKKTAKNKELMDIRKLLLRKNFMEDIRMIIELRDLSPKELKSFLINRDFVEEAEVIENEQVDGTDFIILFSEAQGMKILEKVFFFQPNQIEKLKILYYEIYLLRSHFSRDFEQDEYPVFLSNNLSFK